MHFSTDYVFDGSGYCPWREPYIPAPLNAYGQNLWVSGDHRQWLSLFDNPLQLVALPMVKQFLQEHGELSHEHDELYVVCDQIGTPASAIMLAEDTLVTIDRILAELELIRLYHVVASGAVSWFDYARFIFSDTPRLGLIDKELGFKPITSVNYDGVAN